MEMNSNRTFMMIAIGAILMSATFMGCKSSKTQVTQSPNITENRANTTPFPSTGEEPPCMVFSNEKEFAAVGIASGPSTQKGSIQKAALANAQDMIRAMMEHAYNGFVDTWMESIGANQGTDIETETRSVGRQTIMQIVSITDPVCLKFSNVDAKGNVECYIGVKVSKEKISQAVSDNLSKNQKEDIRKRAADARKEMDEYFKKITE